MFILSNLEAKISLFYPVYFIHRRVRNEGTCHSFADATSKKIREQNTASSRTRQAVQLPVTGQLLVTRKSVFTGSTSENLDDVFLLFSAFDLSRPLSRDRDLDLFLDRDLK